jgi:hypothetical protein
MKHLVVFFVRQQLVRELEHAAVGPAPAALGHPDGAVAESERGGELEHGGAEDGARVDGVADVVRDGADDAPDGLLAAPDGGEVAVEDSRTLRRSRRGKRIGRETAAAEVASAPRTLAAVSATRRAREPGRS